MTRVSRAAKVGVLISMIASLIALASCTKHDDCSCFNAGVVVSAPKGEVTAITSSGVACDGAKINCTDEARGEFHEGCEQYSVMPNGAGECQLHIETKTAGSFDERRDVEDRRNEPCCGGFYVSPSSSSEIVVAKGR